MLSFGSPGIKAALAYDDSAGRNCGEAPICSECDERATQYCSEDQCNSMCADVSPGVGTRHLESPEEIQMYCSDSIHIYRAVYEVHMYIYMLGYR